MNIQRLKDTLAVQTSSDKEEAMRQFIHSQVKAIPGTQICYDAVNIYVTKGEALLYPCVVAHMDTVHDCYKDFQIYQTGDNLFAMDTHAVRQVGIGGDDKVGVFIALEMLRIFDNLKVVFFSNEEIGCVGSSQATLTFFEDCSFVLQCDRMGNKDFIQYGGYTELFGPEFEDKVLPLLVKRGYEPSEGYLTDVVELKERGLEIAVANIACGYYNPHTDQEYVNIQDVINCHALVREIIEKLGHEKHDHFPDWLSDFPDEPEILPHITSIGVCLDCESEVKVDEMFHPYCPKCNTYLSDSEYTEELPFDRVA